MLRATFPVKGHVLQRVRMYAALAKDTGMYCFVIALQNWPEFIPRPTDTLDARYQDSIESK